MGYFKIFNLSVDADCDTDDMLTLQDDIIKLSKENLVL